MFSPPHQSLGEIQVEAARTTNTFACTPKPPSPTPTTSVPLALRVKVRLVVRDTQDEDETQVTQHLLSKKCETRVTTVSVPLSFRQLERQLIALFSLNSQTVGLHYTDEEGDVITVGCNRDVSALVETFCVSSSNGGSRAVIYVVVGMFASRRRSSYALALRDNSPSDEFGNRNDQDQRQLSGMRYSIYNVDDDAQYDQSTLLWKELARLGRNVARLRRENKGLRAVLMAGHGVKEQRKGADKEPDARCRHRIERHNRTTTTTRTTTIVAHRHEEQVTCAAEKCSEVSTGVDFKEIMEQALLKSTSCACNSSNNSGNNNNENDIHCNNNNNNNNNNNMMSNSNDMSNSNMSINNNKNNDKNNNSKSNSKSNNHNIETVSDNNNNDYSSSLHEARRVEVLEQENCALRELVSKITCALDVTDDFTIHSHATSSGQHQRRQHGALGSTDNSSKSRSSGGGVGLAQRKQGYESEALEEQFDFCDDFVLLASPLLSLHQFQLDGQQYSATARFRQAERARVGWKTHSVGSNGNDTIEERESRYNSSSSSFYGASVDGLSDGNMSDFSDASLFAVVAGGS